MAHAFNVCGSVMALEGPERLVQALASMFTLCPSARGEADLILESLLLTDQQDARDSLPPWLSICLDDDATGDVPRFAKSPAGESGALAVCEGRLCAAWTESPRRLHFAGMVDPHKRTAAVMQTVLVPVLRDLWLTKGSVLLHAGALRAPDGSGVLVIAPAGGGKTTTVLSLLRKGSRLLGDDLVTVRLEDDGPRMYGIPEALNLTEDTTHFFEELGDVPPSLLAPSGSPKKAVDPTRIYGSGCLVESCAPDVVYAVRIDPQGPVLVPLGLGDALRTLSEAHLFINGQKMDEQSADILCAVLNRAPVYELRTGPDPGAMGQWLIDNMTSHAGRVKHAG